MSNPISEKFPFQSHYIGVENTNIHFVDETTKEKADTVFLFVHGNPTSSYLWRNIIPYTIPYGRCIALDLVGFGKSGKPDIEYTFQDNIKYFNSFVSKLNLTNIILVVHDWGGAIGFNYAKYHPENIKGIVFMETFCKPMEWKDLDILTRFVFKKFRDNKTGQKWNGKYNAFLRFILPMSINRKLTEKEKLYYFSPFKTIADRKPIIKFPQELPFKGEGTLNESIAEDYFNWLKKSSIPKLLLYANPGVQIQSKEIDLYKSVFKNLTTAFIGNGKHYIQEDQPDKIGEAIEQWYLLNW
ncbi:haloalkane dehalogenase [Fontibacter flavus]|uniref:Haloalkane dehalogenase n=1 Tax=Fontibacter flavus TaxID=654838 RepID=A0ABV6FYP6_9BACT